MAEAKPPKNPYNVSQLAAEKTLQKLGIKTELLVSMNREELAFFKACMNKMLRYAKFNADKLALSERGINFNEICPGSTILVAFKKKIQPAIMMKASKLKRVKVWLINGDTPVLSLDKIVRYLPEEPVVPLQNSDLKPLPKAVLELKQRWPSLQSQLSP